MDMNEIWTTEEETTSPRTKRPDWDGAAYYKVGNTYQVPELHILAEATVWEYAREVDAVCKLVEDHRQGRKNNPRQVRGFIDPVIRDALAACPDFPSKSYLERESSSQFGNCLDAGEEWTPFPRFRNKLAKYVYKRHQLFGWTINSACLAGSNSFELRSHELSQSTPGPLNWIVIARKGDLNYKIDPDKIDQRVRILSKQPDGYFKNVYNSDDDNLVISTAYTDFETRCICLNAPKLFFRGSYTFWRLPLEVACARAENNTLGTNFQKVYCRCKSPVYLWERAELEKALRTLFAYRFARANLGSIPPTLRIGKKSKAMMFPLSPVRSCGREVHKLAKEVLPMAHTIFSELRNIKLLSEAAAHVLPNSGTSLHFGWDEVL